MALKHLEYSSCFDVWNKFLKKHVPNGDRMVMNPTVESVKNHIKHIDEYMYIYIYIHVYIEIYIYIYYFYIHISVDWVVPTPVLVTTCAS